MATSMMETIQQSLLMTMLPVKLQLKDLQLPLP